MNLTKKLRALRQTDDKMHRQITEAFPPDWDMDAVLEKSLRNYRERSAGKAFAPGEPAMQKPESRRILPHFSRGLATAACLAVAVGVTGIGLYLQHTLSCTPVLQTEPFSTAVTAEQTTGGTEASGGTGTSGSTAAEQTADGTAVSVSGSAEQTASDTEQFPKTDTPPSVSGTAGSLSGGQTAASSGTQTGASSGSGTAVTTTVTTASSSSQQSSSSQPPDETFSERPGGTVGGPEDSFRLSHPGDGFARLTCAGSPAKLRQDLRLMLRLSGYSLTEVQSQNPEHERIFRLYGPWGSDPVQLSLHSYESFLLRANEKLTVTERGFLGGNPGYIIHDPDAAMEQGFIYVWDTGECVAAIAAGKEKIQMQIEEIALNLTRY